MCEIDRLGILFVKTMYQLRWEVHYASMLNHIETIREKRNRYEKCEYKLEQKLLNNIQSII